MEDHRQWIKLVNKVYENSKVAADALFVHGWGDLSEELIAFTAEVFKEARARYIVLNGEEAYDNFKGAKGFSYWKDVLVGKYGVPEAAISSFLPGKHTGDEAKGYMDFASANGIKEAIVISVPAHIVRAYLTDLGEALKRGADLKLHPRTLQGTNWEEKVEILGLTGTLDAEETTRLGRVFSEVARMIEYRKRAEAGDPGFTIASLSEGLEHLNK